MTEVVDLVVIGGGIHGCSAALHAAMRGLSVIVIEKDSVARHASGVNAGGVRRLGRHFAEIPISQRSMELWNDIEALVDDDCGFTRAPVINVAENEAEFETVENRAAKVRALGYEHEVILDQTQLREYLPAVSHHCVGGIATIDEGFALPYQTTFAFQRKARSLGVKFREGQAAARVWRQGPDWKVECLDGEIFTGRFLLNCAGAWADNVASQLGEPVPVEAVAPMMIVTNPMPRFCDVVVGATARPLSLKQMRNGTVVIGGGRLGRAEPSTNASEMLFEQLRLTAETAISMFPIMASATIIRTWSGIEGMMSDGIPVIGRSSTQENAFHAFGFSTHGFQMGPGVGAIMAELIATGATDVPIEPFSITRFSGSHARKNDAQNGSALEMD